MGRTYPQSTSTPVWKHKAGITHISEVEGHVTREEK